MISVHAEIMNVAQNRGQSVSKLPLQLLTWMHIKPEGTFCVFVCSVLCVPVHMLVLPLLPHFLSSLFLVLSLVGEIKS